MSVIKRRISGVILDWAGTTVDHGSCAPTKVFIDIFRGCGVEITTAEAREPMGRSKREHIAAIAAMPRVAALWQAKHGAGPTDSNVQEMYERFLPMQKSTLANGSDVIPGVAVAIDQLRKRGIKIGSSTGYTRELMEVVVPIAARGGYAPDVVVCSDDVTVGRPAPWMNFRVAEQMGVFPMSSVIVVDDTPVGIEAGLNAGAIAVAVSRTGNSMGLSLEQLVRLAPQELADRLATIEKQYLQLGADFVIQSVADLPQLVELIDPQ